MSNSKRGPAFSEQQVKRAGRWIVVILYTLILLVTLSVARNVWEWIGAKQAYIVLIVLYCGAVGFIYYRYKNILVIGLLLLISIAIFRLIPLPVERIHFIEYGILGWLVWWAAGKRKWGLITALGYIIAISILDEVIQGILPNRVYDIRDILMNVAGGGLGLALRIYAR